MGTPEFAVPTLNALINTHDVRAVVTQTDKPCGRGKKQKFTPVKEAALSHNIPVLQPVRIKEAQCALEEFNAQVFVVVAYGQILPQTLLNIPPMGCINVHGSLLPKYRGAAPVHYAIMNGETVTGVTVMQMDEGMDTGDMLLRREIVISPKDDTGSLLERMSHIGADALIDTLKLLEQGNISPVKQDDSQATYARMITKEMGHIDWNATVNNVVNKVRGLNPSPGAYTSYMGQRLKILEAAVYDEDRHSYIYKQGEIIGILPQKGILVQANDGSVLITRIQSQGGKKLSAADYLRGHTMEAGTILL